MPRVGERGVGGGTALSLLKILGTVISAFTAQTLDVCQKPFKFTPLGPLARKTISEIRL